MRVEFVEGTMAVAVSYPQRPGETECQYYMKTGTCKYAQKCKFHHPPDITPSFCPLAPATDVTIGLNKEAYPRRPGEQSCTFFLKTGTCKYKMSCKFDHPPEAIQQTLQLQNTPYPRRPGEQHCSYYLKTSKCKFGATCRYDHPDLRPEHSGMMGPSYHQSGPLGPEPRVIGVPPPMATPYYGHHENLVTLMPPQQHPMAYNPGHLPQRPGEKECTFFLKTARCQYGSRCKFHHPAEKLAGNLAPLGVMGMPTMGPTPYPMGPAGVPMDPYMGAYGPPVPPMAPPPMPRSNSQGGPMPMDMQSTPAAMLPERPGHEACGYFLRTGQCAFGMNCRFDHPRQNNGLASDKRTSPAAAGKDGSNKSEGSQGMHENGEKADPVHDGQMHNNGAEMAAAGQNPHAHQNGGYYATAAAAGVVYGDNGNMVYQKVPAEYGSAYPYPQYTAAGYASYRAQA